MYPDGGIETRGFPAISPDGTLIVVTDLSVHPGSDESIASISIQRARDGHVVERIHEARGFCSDHERGCAASELADRAARFAQRANRLLRRGGYRTMATLTPVAADGDVVARPVSEHAGAGLRVRLDEERRNVTIETPRGRVLWRGRLPRMRASCGMVTTGDDDDWWNPEILAVHTDEATDTVLLVYGLRYDSCMCDYEDRASRVLRIRH